MRVQITITEIRNEEWLREHYFREQAIETFNEFYNRSTLDDTHTSKTLDELTDGMDIEDVEGLFFEMSVEEVANELGFYELEEEEDEEDEAE